MNKDEETEIEDPYKLSFLKDNEDLVLKEITRLLQEPKPFPMQNH